jgi:hypothetical protein
MAKATVKQNRHLDPLQSARAALESILGDFSDEKALRKAEAEALRLKRERQAAKAKRAKAKLDT